MRFSDKTGAGEKLCKDLSKSVWEREESARALWMTGMVPEPTCTNGRERTNFEQDYLWLLFFRPSLNTVLCLNNGRKFLPEAARAVGPRGGNFHINVVWYILGFLVSKGRQRELLQYPFMLCKNSNKYANKYIKNIKYLNCGERDQNMIDN